MLLNMFMIILSIFTNIYVEISPSNVDPAIKSYILTLIVPLCGRKDIHNTNSIYGMMREVSESVTTSYLSFSTNNLFKICG